MKPQDIRSLRDIATYPDAVGITGNVDGTRQLLLWDKTPLIVNSKTYDMPVMVAETNEINTQDLIVMLSASHVAMPCTYMDVMFHDENGDDYTAIPIELTLWVKS